MRQSGFTNHSTFVIRPAVPSLAPPGSDAVASSCSALPDAPWKPLEGDVSDTVGKLSVDATHAASVAYMGGRNTENETASK